MRVLSERDGARRSALRVLSAALVVCTAALSADFSNVAVIGDSLSAGMQNLSLVYTTTGSGQTASYVNLVHRQATGQDMVLPLISPPGFPPPYSACLVGNEPRVIPPAVPTEATPALLAGILSMRLNPEQQSRNFAVPGQKMHDALYMRPGFPAAGSTPDEFAIKMLTNLILGYPGVFNYAALSNPNPAAWLKFPPLALTQIESLEVMVLRGHRPSLLFVWTGNNDGLEAVRAGDPARLTKVSAFAADFAALMARVALLRIPHVVVATLADPTGTAFVVPVSALQLPQPGAILIDDETSLTNADYLTIEGVAIVRQALAGGGLPPSLPGSMVITAAEHRTIRETVMAYNAAIKATVRAYKLLPHRKVTFVDAWSEMAKVQASGVPVFGGAAVLNTSMFGGLFSLDGVHPTNTGYAVIANWFINSLNAGPGGPSNHIQLVDVSAVAAADPLVNWQTHLPACPATVQ